MTKRSAAALVGGDERVVAHPSYRDLPKCKFPLKSKEAQEEYDKVARLLHDAGHMTAIKHQLLSSYALQFDIVQTYPGEGKMLKAANFASMDRAYEKLKLNDLSTPISAPQGAQANKFARSGFASRRR